MKKENRVMVYRSYVSDCLQYISENTAKFAGGRYTKQRFIELAYPEKKKPEDTRSGQEIANDIISRLTQGGDNTDGDESV